MALKKLSLPQLPSVPGAVEQVEIAIFPQRGGIMCLHHTAPAQLALGPCHAMGRAKPSKTAASRATLRAAWQWCSPGAGKNFTFPITYDR